MKFVEWKARAQKVKLIEISTNSGLFCIFRGWQRFNKLDNCSNANRRPSNTITARRPPAGNTNSKGLVYAKLLPWYFVLLQVFTGLFLHCHFITTLTGSESKTLTELQNETRNFRKSDKSSTDMSKIKFFFSINRNTAIFKNSKNDFFRVRRTRSKLLWPVPPVFSSCSWFLLPRNPRSIYYT